jgi:hypothetical protein
LAGSQWGLRSLIEAIDTTTPAGHGHVRDEVR